MADLIMKLRVLHFMIGNAWSDWKSQIWSKDLDGQSCCDGRECCCGGETIREQWSWFVEKKHG